MAPCGKCVSRKGLDEVDDSTFMWQACVAFAMWWQPRLEFALDAVGSHTTFFFSFVQRIVIDSPQDQLRFGYNP